MAFGGRVGGCIDKVAWRGVCVHGEVWDVVRIYCVNTNRDFSSSMH